MDPDRVHWWQVHATVKWAVICSLQASAHLSGVTRSVELAAIGRRVCESEWDLFTLLGVAPGDPAPEPVAKGNPVAPFGRPTAAELVEAVREYLEANVMERSDGGARFEARVARNVLGIVERELVYGRDVAAAHAYRLRDLGISDDAALAAAIRAGDFDDGWEPVAAALAASARDSAPGGQPLLPSGRQRVAVGSTTGPSSNATVPASAVSGVADADALQDGPASRLQTIMKIQA